MTAEKEALAKKSLEEKQERMAKEAERLAAEKEAQRRLEEEKAESAKKALEEKQEKIAREKEAQRLLAEEKSALAKKVFEEKQEKIAKEKEAQRLLEEEKAELAKKALEEKQARMAKEAGRVATEKEAQRRLVEEKAEIAKKALAEKQEKVAQEKVRLLAEQEIERLAAEEAKSAKKNTILAFAKRPYQNNPREIARDGHFIAYDNGTVLDTRKNMMWAAKDNGDGINWVDAKKYCENYRGGGYTDWRMPSKDELAGLWDLKKSQTNEAFPKSPLPVTELIDVSSCSVWTSETHKNVAQSELLSPISAVLGPFAVIVNYCMWIHPALPQSGGEFTRALPVRAAK